MTGRGVVPVPSTIDGRVAASGLRRSAGPTHDPNRDARQVASGGGLPAAAAAEHRPGSTTGDATVGVAGGAVDMCGVPQVHPEAVARVRSRLPRPTEVTAVASMFRLLGDPTRARILYALLEAGELCVCDIAAATDTSESTVSAALRLLRTAQVATGRRHGRMVYYRLADDHVRSLLELSRAHVTHDRDDAGDHDRDDAGDGHAGDGRDVADAIDQTSGLGVASTQPPQRREGHG